MAIVNTKLDEPILFRTVKNDVYPHTLSGGSIWLRTNVFYQELEADDLSREDRFEGINVSGLFTEFNFEGGMRIKCEHGGLLGTEHPTHYVMSLHGLNIKEEIRLGFGGNTLGIKSLVDLANDVLQQASKQINVSQCGYGQVSYQYLGLKRTRANTTGKIIGYYVDGIPEALVQYNPNVMTKIPIEPFIGQDEWRIILQTDKPLNDDPMEPLKINVDPSHFYEL